MKVDHSKLRRLEILRYRTFAFILFLMLIIGLSIFTISMSIIWPADRTEALFDYRINNNINYQVHLFPNNLYPENTLEMGKQYPTEIVKNIEVEFRNNLSVSKNAFIDYDYEITAQINGTYSTGSNRDNTEIWTRDFTLVPKKHGKASRIKNNTIKETKKIDFAYYNQMVTDYKQELRLNIDASLIVKMTINIHGKVGHTTFTEKQELELDIPLNRAAFQISNNTPEQQKETVYSTGELHINYPFFIAALIFLIISLVLVIRFILNIRKINRKTEFSIKLNKILKAYGEVIATTETTPNYSKYEILDIIDFIDLMDIQNEMRIPIIYYEHILDTEGWFTVVHNDQMYRYILSDTTKKIK